MSNIDVFHGFTFVNYVNFRSFVIHICKYYDFYLKTDFACSDLFRLERCFSPVKKIGLKTG